jgi:chromosome segregation ATPase
MERRHMHVAATLETRLSDTECKLTAALLHNDELQARIEQATKDLQKQVDTLLAQLKGAKRAQKAAEAEEKRIRNLHETNRHGSLHGASRTKQRAAMRARTPKQPRRKLHTEEADEDRREMLRVRSRQRARSGPSSSDRGILSEPIQAADAWY